MKKTNWSYDSLSTIYSTLANVYSLGMIRKSKKVQVEKYMKPNKKALYVGVGSGEDAIMAAMKGIDVTCLDISDKMINTAKKNFKKNKVKGTFYCIDIIDFDKFDEYDYVVVNYFFNNFNFETLELWLNHIPNFLKRDGKLLIADFVVDSNFIILRLVQNFNFLIAVAFFSVLGVAPFHKMVDYTKLIEKTNLEISDISYCKLLNVFPPLYGTMALKNKGDYSNE